MHINRISNFKEYQSHLQKKNKQIKVLQGIDFKLNQKIKTLKQFYIDGYSWTAKSNSKFLVDTLYSNGNELNLRERLICNKTKLNNRVRGCIHIFETLFKPQSRDKIYMTEQVSLLAKWTNNK